MPAVLVFTTTPDRRSANKLAASLIEHRLAACVSITEKVISHYRWKGKIRRSSESLLWIKTRRTAFTRVKAHLEKYHPYDLPEVIAVEVTAGSPEYLEWMGESVR
jgi:periplasmic divalent cation tolerance protein